MAFTSYNLYDIPGLAPHMHVIYFKRHAIFQLASQTEIHHTIIIVI